MPKVRPKLDRLAETINAEHAAGESARRKGLDHFRKAGLALIDAKAQCGRRWLKWLAEHCPEINERRAQRYMALAECDVTSDLRAEWRRINGNPPRTESTDSPTLQVHDDDDSGDGAETFDPGDEPEPRPEIRTVQLWLPVAIVGEFESMVKSLHAVFGTDNTTDTAIEAVRFAYKETINAARLEAV